MKILTICVLSENVKHEGHVLDTCDVPVYDSNEQVFGYLGATWGLHARPDWPEILLWEQCSSNSVDSILEANGMHRKFEIDIPS